VDGNSSSASPEIVLRGALEVLCRVGYNKLRTTDVAHQSGLSEGTLFHYFHTKNELIAAAVEHALDTAMTAAAEQFAALEPPFDRRSMLYLLWNLMAAPELTWLNEVFAAVKTDTELAAAVAPVILASSEAIEQVATAIMMRVGGVDEREAPSLAEFFIMTLQGLAGSALARGLPGREIELIEYLLFLWDTMYPEQNEIALPGLS
jgi:AcrR family transcriptional regulator